MYFLDDDFADSTPPMPKKPKLSIKENKEKKKDKSLSKTQNKAKERKYVRTFYVIVLSPADI